MWGLVDEEGLSAGGECVVPVVGGWPQSLDGGMEGDHPGSGGVAGVVRVEAAVESIAAGNQCTEPRRMGANTRGGDADALRIHLEATDCIDGGFTEDDFPRTRDANPEIPQVLACARRHSPPDTQPGAAQSAPTGRLALPATNTKTALPRRSAYNLPDSISESMSDAARQRRLVR